jgi:carbazole 1,9a-dioxygenase terminal dioxygenase component
MSSIVEKLVQDTEEYLEQEKAAHKRPWQRWIEAELGLRNYWYPAALSRQVAEGKALPVQLLGEEILLTRQDGRVYAIEDRCCHRGVRFSKRPLFYTKDTITCWYHTFTYNLDDGKLRCVLNEPGCALVGKVGVKSYPLTEAKGVVFVFIGDIEPPALVCDLPPGFLDEDMAIYAAEPYEVRANWRLGCENGFDPGHHFIHNWSNWILALGIPITFGLVVSKGKLHEVTKYEVHEPGPKGFTRWMSATEMIMEANIPGKDGTVTKVTLPGAKGKSSEELKAMVESLGTLEVGLWLPAGLKVFPAPAPPSHVYHYEFYVPKDEKTHIYFQFGGKRVKSPDEYQAWAQEDGHYEWEVKDPQGFTPEDAFAREGLEKFYAEEDGWYRERLYRPDVEITMWRKFASEHARGIQTREHTKGMFSR